MGAFFAFVSYVMNRQTRNYEVEIAELISGKRSIMVVFYDFDMVVFCEAFSGQPEHLL